MVSTDWKVFFWVNKRSPLPSGGMGDDLNILFTSKNSNEMTKKESAPLHFKFVLKNLTDFASHNELYQVSAWC